ncbi:MAG: hypothetical protein IT200_04970 [Thermoleophilia bacterium]|nr:hypothetical protein [Thermoleophilia bacterium]
MGIAQLIEVVTRRAWIVAVVTAVAIIVAAFATAVRTPVYEATATLRIQTRPGSTGAVREDDLLYADRLANTYRAILGSRPIRERLAQRLGTDTAPEAEITLPADTELLRITARDADGNRAAAAANALGDILVADVAPAGTVTRVEEAERPGGASSPSWPLALALGLLLGAAGGAVAAIVADRRDPRVRAPRQLEAAAGAHVLAEIPPLPADDPGPVRVFNTGSVQEEAYRALRVALLAQDPDDQGRVLLFCATGPGEHAASVAANTAAALAKAGREVLAVDADLREPRLHTAFRVGGARGLAQVLQGTADIADVTRRAGRNGPMVLPAGRGGANPGALLGSPALPGLMDRLAVDYDIVIVSGPPVTGVADSQVIAPCTDGVVLVVPGGGVSSTAVADASRRLSLLGAPVTGVVLCGGRARRGAREIVRSAAARAQVDR